MRQRTVSDFFWRDPEICDLSQEDKATLLYLLTSSSSNLIGVYQVVPRIAAAEMGWTADQLVAVLERLQLKGLINFTNSGWVWIKIWWKHNSAPGSFSPTLKKHAKKQIDEMPLGWRDDFLQLLELAGIDRVSIGYPYPIDTPPLNTNTNINTTTNQVVVDQIDDLVEAAVWAACKGGKVLKNESGFRHKVRARFLSGDPSLEDLRSLSAWQESNKREAAQDCARVEERKISSQSLDPACCKKGASLLPESLKKRVIKKS